jgi:hypothetical protein
VKEAKTKLGRDDRILLTSIFQMLDCHCNYATKWHNDFTVFDLRRYVDTGSLEEDKEIDFEGGE